MKNIQINDIILALLKFTDINKLCQNIKNITNYSKNHLSINLFYVFYTQKFILKSQKGG